MTQQYDLSEFGTQHEEPSYDLSEFGAQGSSAPKANQQYAKLPEGLPWYMKMMMSPNFMKNPIQAAPERVKAVGRGLQDIGEGAKQVYLENFGEPGQAEDYTERKEAGRKSYEESNQGRDPLLQMLRGHTANLPEYAAGAVMLPEAGLLKQMLAGGIAMGTAKHGEFVPKGESRALNTAEGVLIGAGVPAAFKAVETGAGLVKSVVGKAPKAMTLEEQQVANAIKENKAKLTEQEDILKKSEEEWTEQQRASQEAVGGKNPELMKYSNKKKNAAISDLDNEINDLTGKLDEMKPITPLDEHVKTSENALSEVENTTKEAKDLHQQAIQAKDAAQEEYEAAEQGKKGLEGEHAKLAREHQGLEDTHEAAQTEHAAAKAEHEKAVEQTTGFFGKGRDYAKRGGEVLKKSLQEVLDFWPKHYKNWIGSIEKKNVKLPEHALSELQDNIKSKKELAAVTRDVASLKKQSDKIRKDLHKTLGTEKDELQHEIDAEVADTDVADTTGNPYLDRLLKYLPSKGKYKAFDVIGKFQDFKAMRFRMQKAMKRGESFANRELMAEAIEKTGDLMPLIERSLEKGLSPRNYKTWKWLNNGYTNEYFPVRNSKTVKAIIKQGKLPNKTIDVMNSDEPEKKIMQDIIKSKPELNKDVLAQHYNTNPEEIFRPGEKTGHYVKALPELQPHIANEAKATELAKQKESVVNEAKQRINESEKAQRSAKNTVEDYQKTMDERKAAIKQAGKNVEVTKRHADQLTAQHKEMTAKHNKLMGKAKEVQKNISAQDKARIDMRDKISDAQATKLKSEKELKANQVEIEKLLEKRSNKKLRLDEKVMTEKKIKELKARQDELQESIDKSTGVLRILTKAGWKLAKNYVKKSVNLQ
jgi:hypothetical protein